MNGRQRRSRSPPVPPGRSRPGVTHRDLDDIWHALNVDVDALRRENRARGFEIAQLRAAVRSAEDQMQALRISARCAQLEIAQLRDRTPASGGPIG